MARVLTVARVRVAVTHQDEYLALLGQIEARTRSRGRHLWVFRSDAEPELFLEFREGSADPAPASSGHEGELERRLHELAPRDVSAAVPWREISLPPTAT